MSPIGKLADYANCADYCDDHCDDHCDDPSGFPVWVWPLSLTVWAHSLTVCPSQQVWAIVGPGFDDRAAVKLTVVSTFACELLQFALCNGDMVGPMRDG